MPISDTYVRLSAPFDKTFKDPRGLDYLTGNQVISRMNEVLGPGGWSFEIKEHGYDQESDEMWVLGHLEAVIDGSGVVREQFGSQRHNRRRDNTKAILDYGFDVKGAGTDSFKKCCSLIGVGLYLSEKEGGITHQIEPDVSPQNESSFKCKTCGNNIVTPEGVLITAGQAKMIRDRFGDLFCRDHRVQQPSSSR